jgi:hypothetical protein
LLELSFSSYYTFINQSSIQYVISFPSNRRHLPRPPPERLLPPPELPLERLLLPEELTPLLLEEEEEDDLEGAE